MNYKIQIRHIMHHSDESPVDSIVASGTQSTDWSKSEETGWRKTNKWENPIFDDTKEYSHEAKEWRRPC